MLFMSCVCHGFVSVHCCLVHVATAGKGLFSWLSFVMFNCVFVTFPCGILGQGMYLIVLIPDLCHLSYFDVFADFFKINVFKIFFRKSFCQTVWIQTFCLS